MWSVGGLGVERWVIHNPINMYTQIQSLFVFHIILRLRIPGCIAEWPITDNGLRNKCRDRDEARHWYKTRALSPKYLFKTFGINSNGCEFTYKWFYLFLLINENVCNICARRIFKVRHAGRPKVWQYKNVRNWYFYVARVGIVTLHPRVFSKSGRVW